MKLYFHFRHSKPSKRVQQYLLERVEKLQRFEMKPVTCDVTLKVERGVHKVEFHARGSKKVMRAHAQGDDFIEAADIALTKLVRQMEKNKAKTKNHKCYERSHMGKLDQLAETMSPIEAETAHQHEYDHEEMAEDAA